MKRCAFSVLVVTLFSAALHAGAVDIVRIWPGYRTAESFETVGEFFGRGEHTGGRVLLRSRSESRAGFYFLTRLQAQAAHPQAEVRLEVILPGSVTPVVHTFTTALKAGSTVLQVGVTGTDWDDSSQRPVAWRLAIRDPSSSTPLAETESFLWATPGTP